MFKLYTINQINERKLVGEFETGDETADYMLKHGGSYVIDHLVKRDPNIGKHNKPKEYAIKEYVTKEYPIIPEAYKKKIKEKIKEEIKEETKDENIHKRGKRSNKNERKNRNTVSRSS